MGDAAIVLLFLGVLALALATGARISLSGWMAAQRFQERRRP